MAHFHSRLPLFYLGSYDHIRLRLTYTLHSRILSISGNSAPTLEMKMTNDNVAALGRRKVNRSQLAELCKVSVVTVDDWVKADKLPQPFKAGPNPQSPVIFDIDECLASIERYEIERAQAEVVRIKADVKAFLQAFNIRLALMLPGEVLPGVAPSGYEQEAQLYGGGKDAYQANNAAIARNPHLQPKLVDATRTPLPNIASLRGKKDLK
jgi:hypothetical protein